MKELDLILKWASLLVPLATMLFAFIYGLKHFFKKGKPLFVQSLTMAMGSHTLGSAYQLCLTLSNNTRMEGFTPMYLGHIGFFLFIITASYGQLDRIVDDGSPRMRPARFIALIAPVCAALLYVPLFFVAGTPFETKIAYALVWIPAIISVYFNLKHAIIPDLDFNFIKVLKPYNILVLCLGFSELFYLMSWKYVYSIPMAIFSVIFGLLAISTMISARKGVEKWII